MRSRVVRARFLRSFALREGAGGTCISLLNARAEWLLQDCANINEADASNAACMIP
jgi:hypothetical protein